MPCRSPVSYTHLDVYKRQALVRELAPLAALVNNAGLFDERKFFDVTSDDYRRMYDVNLLAVATLTQEAARDMAAGSKIVNIASRAYLGARNHPHYVCLLYTSKGQQMLTPPRSFSLRKGEVRRAPQRPFRPSDERPRRGRRRRPEQHGIPPERPANSRKSETFRCTCGIHE